MQVKRTSLEKVIKGNRRLKSILQFAITSRNPKPRWWVRKFILPLHIRKGKGALIRRRSRLDIFPWNPFVIGSYSTIEDFCVINNGAGHVIIGDNVRVGIGSVVVGPVKIEEGVALGQNVNVSGFNHGYSDISKNSRSQELSIKETVIGKDALIGSNSAIVAGVVIGEKCQIGAGSVVTKNIPPFSVAVGNPAKVIKRYDENLRKWVRV